MKTKNYFMSLSKTLVLFAEKKLSPNLDHAPVLREQFGVLTFGVIIPPASHRKF